VPLQQYSVGVVQLAAGALARVGQRIVVLAARNLGLLQVHTAHEGDLRRVVELRIFTVSKVLMLIHLVPRPHSS
jgi:hypothetical protein